MLDLLQKMPAGGNAVLVADLAKISQSEVAKQNGWFSTAKGPMESGFGFLPQGAQRLALASKMDFHNFAPTWTTGLITLSDMPAMDTVARVTNGQVDNLAGMPVVATGSDLFIFSVDNDLASFTPANRQELASWIAGLKANKTAGVGAFLQSAVENRDAAQLLVAMDLNYLVSEATVLKRAKESDALDVAGIDPQKFATALASLSGMTVGCSFIDAVYGDLTISFGENVEFLKPVAKKLVLEVMANHGAQVNEVSNWQATVSGNQIQLSGKLSPQGLRRLISLFESPEPHIATSDPNKPPSPAEATKTYFDAVTSLMDELQKDMGQGGQNSYQVSRWFRSYANKIDNLSMAGVDADALNFGAKVSQTFRQIANGATTTRQSVQVKNANLMAYGNGSPAYRNRRYGGGYGYAYPWAWGYGYGWAPNQQADARNANRQQVGAEKRDIQMRARAQASESAQSALTGLVEARQQLLRTLTERYPNTF